MTTAGDLKTCQDCGAATGSPHADGCDTARCLRTGGQRLSCGEPHDCGADVWTGEWPGVAECREFGWYSRFIPGVGWRRCEPGWPGASEDLNRLHGGEAGWDAAAGRWVLQPWAGGPS